MDDCHTGACLEELCQAVPTNPDVALPFVYDLLGVIPNVCAQTHALSDLQQQLPFKAVGACPLLPALATGEHLTSILDLMMHSISTRNTRLDPRKTIPQCAVQ